MAFWGQNWGQAAKDDIAPARLERAVARADIGCGPDRLAPVPRSGSARAQRVRKRVRPWPRAQVGPGVNYARRQQYRWLARAGKAGLGSVAAVLLGLAAGSAGAAALGGLLLLTAARAGPLRSPLAFARPSQPGWRSL